MRRRKPQLCKASNTLIREDEFHHAFPQEDRTGHQSQQDYRHRPINWRLEKPIKYFVHLMTSDGFVLMLGKTDRSAGIFRTAELNFRGNKTSTPPVLVVGRCV